MGTNKQMSKVDNLKARMLKVKCYLPRFYTQLYEYEFGKQSKSSLVKLRNIWGLKIADEEIVSRFELIAEKLKNK